MDWKPHPQLSDCLCFYQRVKTIANGKGKCKVKVKKGKYISNVFVI